MRSRVWFPVATVPLLLVGVLYATLGIAASSSQPVVRPAAKTITVTTTADTNSCGIPCSLRGAIGTADSGDSIVIPSGIYTLTLGSELNIGKSLILNGAGSGHTIIQAGTGEGLANWRVFTIVTGDVAISGVTVRYGGKEGANGGGIYNDGTLTVTNSVIIENIGLFGGGIYNQGTLTVANSIVSGNAAGHGGILRGDGGGGINNRGTLTVANSTVNGNTSIESDGGGIVNHDRLTLTNSSVSQNEAGNRSGGIANWDTLTLTNSAVSGNTAARNAGGIFNGGEGKVVLTNSTVSGNTALFAGGIANWQNSLMALTNSTVSGNTASFEAGGIRNSGGTLSVTNSTVSGNTASSVGGIWNINGSLTLTNSIIADNPSGGDCSGVVTSLGHNLDSDGTCGLNAMGDHSNTDPLLGPLQDNGGPTFTHALLPGSPAINHIPVEACMVTTDQRGVLRPQDDRCDIGAFERALVVNTNDDIDDGVCDANHCSLREAINAANATSGTAEIDFNIPGAGPHTIQPLSALPTITDPVIIDGYTQPGASPNTNGPGLGSNAVLKIELDGTSAQQLAELSSFGLSHQGRRQHHHRGHAQQRSRHRIPP